MMKYESAPKYASFDHFMNRTSKQARLNRRPWFVFALDSLMARRFVPLAGAKVFAPGLNVQSPNVVEREVIGGQPLGLIWIAASYTGKVKDLLEDYELNVAPDTVVLMEHCPESTAPENVNYICRSGTSAAFSLFPDEAGMHKAFVSDAPHHDEDEDKGKE